MSLGWPCRSALGSGSGFWNEMSRGGQVCGYQGWKQGNYSSEVGARPAEGSRVMECSTAHTLSHKSVVCTRWSPSLLSTILTHHVPSWPSVPRDPSQAGWNSWSQQKAGALWEPDIPSSQWNFPTCLPLVLISDSFMQATTDFSLSRVSFLPAAGLSIHPGIQTIPLSQRPLPHTTVRSFPSWEGWRPVSVATSLRSSSACSLNHRIVSFGWISPVDRQLPKSKVVAAQCLRENCPWLCVQSTMIFFSLLKTFYASCSL